MKQKNVKKRRNMRGFAGLAWRIFSVEKTYPPTVTTWWSFCWQEWCEKKWPEESRCSVVHAYELLHPALDGNLENIPTVDPWPDVGTGMGWLIHFFFKKLDSTMGKIAIEPSLFFFLRFFPSIICKSKYKNMWIRLSLRKLRWLAGRPTMNDVFPIEHGGFSGLPRLSPGM